MLHQGGEGRTNACVAMPQRARGDVVALVQVAVRLAGDAIPPAPTPPDRARTLPTLGRGATDLPSSPSPCPDQLIAALRAYSASAAMQRAAAPRRLGQGVFA